MSFNETTNPTYFIDSDSQIVKEFTYKSIQGLTNPVEKAIKLYYSVRDGLRYDPYNISLEKNKLKASSIINQGFGYCVAKAIVLAAVCRAAEIPAKIGFANVRNHLNSKRLQDMMKTDIFVFHGYTEMLLDGKWVKATPAFNIELCKRANLKPLEFDGKSDSIFHEFDNVGNKHMEYLKDYGSFVELPYEQMVDEYDSFYHHLEVKKNMSFGGSFIKNMKDTKFEDEVIKH